ncbi:hypothetical protein BJF80_03125 [Serinicoccus sp. CUA-874]|uniref:hypothetical protein n=1 Tax=Serinicoccus sp. CUA-874 TaxID=1517939 RepID=UPI0009672825|nr:hypothetical protein [Serinicoccus sp. CUA-874]OLT17184.1 hypothetical protein BJF80_03125 [Serinicoccus sp. CUA-874]
MRGGEPPRHVGCGPSGTAGVRDPVVQVERAVEALARGDDGASAALATALELGLPDFPGAVVVASHDRWLGEDWVGERLELSGETLER